MEYDAAKGIDVLQRLAFDSKTTSPSSSQSTLVPSGSPSGMSTTSHDDYDDPVFKRSRASNSYLDETLIRDVKKAPETSRPTRQPRSPCRRFCRLDKPPSRRTVERSSTLDLRFDLHQDAFFSNPRDVSDSAALGRGIRSMADLEEHGTMAGLSLFRHLQDAEGGASRSKNNRFVPAIKPPSRRQATKWGRENGFLKIKSDSNENGDLPSGEFCQPESFLGIASNNAIDQSGIEGPTLAGAFGFKVNQETAFGEVKAVHHASHITVMSLEVHVVCRGDLNPDPEHDCISAVFFSLKTDAPSFTVAGTEPNLSGWILVAPSGSTLRHQMEQIKTNFATGPQFSALSVEAEEQLFDALEFLVRSWDPDVLVGWEIEMLSWGFLLQRGVYLNRNLQSSLSRASFHLEAKRQARRKKEDAETRINLSTDWQSYYTVPGRIMLCGWRTIKYSLTLNNYTFENAVYHILHERVPCYQFSTLSAFYGCGSLELKGLVFSYYMTRAVGNLRLLLQLDLISSTSEMARVFGIMFHDVLTRGTQFRVESMMFRFAKPRNYVLVSPSVEQRAKAKAPVVIPLNLEPESKFYTDPVIVLDFQSLYPSIMIAYNYCYSTCLGRIEHLGSDEEFQFGATRLTVPRQTFDRIKRDINISPGGVAFINRSGGVGVLPKMLSSILSTRIMVKQAMKKYKSDATLKKVLDYRQMGLKLIANVTFGYTAANYSGRMPLVELGDSIVAKSRETLERAIEVVERSPRWNAHVVYGDTDSLFVLLKNRSREEAFKIGEEIAAVITKMNPPPIKLKFEKCYDACVLMTKKRYCGYMRESLSQDPVFEGKGIETVRRDGCSVVSKVLESALKILFRTKDVSLVKSYVQRQMAKLVDGRVPIQDLIIAKEYRGQGFYRPGACVPSLEIAKQRTRLDPRAEPRAGERVPYVIVNGAPGLPLIKMVRTPLELLRDPNLTINTTYYITRQLIPALQRVFGLLNLNVTSWYDQVYQGGVHLQRLGRLPTSPLRSGARAPTTISQFFASSHCATCSEKTIKTRFCASCAADPQRTVLALTAALRDEQRKRQLLSEACHACSGRNPENAGKDGSWMGGRQVCLSFDCPVVFRLATATAAFENLSMAAADIDIDGAGIW